MQLGKIDNWDYKAINVPHSSALAWLYYKIRDFKVKKSDIIVSVKAADPCCVCRASEIVQLRAAICFCYYLIPSVASPGEICVGFEFLCNQAVWTCFFEVLKRKTWIFFGSWFFFSFIWSCNVIYTWIDLIKAGTEYMKFLKHTL